MGFRCTVCVALVAVVMALVPLAFSWVHGGRVREYTHNPLGYTFADIPDLSGRVVIVTGANTGIGKVSAREMARKGATVIVAARSVEKGEAAVKEIKEDVGTEKKVEFMQLDLASLASVRAFAAAFQAKSLPLHVLLLNAGVMMCPYSPTADGFEMQIGTNHLGHFLLTKLLQDNLVASAPSRVVVVSSRAHLNPYEPEGLRLDQFTSDEGYSRMEAYGQSKLANVLMANGFAQRLNGTGVLINSCHPGFIDTDLGRHIEDALATMPGGLLIKLALNALITPGIMDPNMGALTQLYLATHPDIEAHNITGKYYDPIAMELEPSVHAQNATLRELLWEASERLTK